MIIPLVNIVVGFIAAIAFAKAFGKGALFGVGLCLVSFICFPILAFGDAKYEGAAANA